MIPHRLTLDYTLQPGWLAPFVEGLQSGQAVARRCDACGRVSFPPQRTCDCGRQSGDWTTLLGTAEIRFRTSGADGDFALAAFTGAQSLTVARVEGLSPDETLGRLRASQTGAPMIILGPMTTGGAQ
jgi:hypothetical protein